MNEDRRRIVILCIIYLGFISLGLPDTILGVAWPSMRLSFGLPVSSAGILVSVTTICSVFSSVASGALSQRFGAGAILAASGLLTGAALLGYSLSTLWVLTIILTLALGVGQGAVDTAINAYVAKNYSSRHMNWLHCCWGVGATGGPLIMTATLDAGLSWRSGYLAISLIQLSLALLFAATLKLWMDREKNGETTAEKASGGCAGDGCKNRRIAAAAGCLFFFFYPGVEVVAGLWGVSFLMDVLDTPIKTAGLSISLYWAALTAGRFGTGIVSNGISNRNILRVGIGMALIAALLLSVSGNITVTRGALLLLGFGIGPLYPTMTHDTPRRLGREKTDRAIGLQIASNFLGVFTLPALAGYVATHTSLKSYGPTLILFTLLVALANEVSLAYARR